MIKTITSVIGLGIVALILSACDPEVGSKEWCAAMDEKPKGDWSTNEAADYAKNCVLK